MMKLKAGDKVRITTGKDKGREGEVERVFPAEGRALIPGMNLYKKHVKGMPGQKAGIYEVPRPIPFSNLAVICPKCKKPTRVGFKYVGDNKIRICRKCGREMDTKSKSKAKKK